MTKLGPFIKFGVSEGVTIYARGSMPEPSVVGKRRIPTSSSMFAEEIERAHMAARVEGITMSEFIRQATIERAERVLGNREQAAPAA